VTLLRRELQDVVRAYAVQTGSTPAMVNAEIKRVVGGVPTPLATLEELQERIDEMEREYAELEEVWKAEKAALQGNTAIKEKLEKATTRKMDCIDCHNRPTHAFQLPDRALDKAFAEKRISTELPFLKKKAVELLKAEYKDQGDAAAKIPVAVAEYYRTTYPEIFKHKRAQVDAAGEVVKAIYMRNVFPEMKITWGTHPNNIGHEEAVGCFRCHDGTHTAADGKVIKGDCDTCHTILAQDSKDPKILKEYGIIQ